MIYRMLIKIFLLTGMLFNFAHSCAGWNGYDHPGEAFCIGFMARAISHYIGELTAHQIINDRWLTKDAEEKFEWFQKTYPSTQNILAEGLPLLTTLISLAQAISLWVYTRQQYAYLRSIPNRRVESMRRAYDGGMAAYLLLVAALSLGRGFVGIDKVPTEVAKSITAFIVALFAHYCAFVILGSRAAQQVRKDDYLPAMAFYIIGTIASFFIEKWFFALGALEPCEPCRIVYHAGSDAAFASWWALPDFAKFANLAL